MKKEIENQKDELISENTEGSNVSQGTVDGIVEPESIQDALKHHYNIPKYQRGYRWGKEQVNALLDDLYEFYNHKNALLESHSDNKEIYCIQPLVVKFDDKTNIRNVVDGQQRLTTIYILMRFLDKEAIPSEFVINYESRTEDISSWDFLEKLTVSDSKTSEADSLEFQDFYYMYIVNKSIKKWIPRGKESPWEGIDKRNFASMISKWVFFIRYNLPDYEKEIDVFKRLNIGKIKLTESELIKAVFLNKYNYRNKADTRLLEIASEWDRIEYRLQDDRFWLFIHEKNYDSPTRIDFILELAMKSDDSKNVHNSTYPVFDYYYDRINSDKDRERKLKESWKGIHKVYGILCEWYNDEELYHYIGYLSTIYADQKGSDSAELIYELIKERKNCDSKTKFVNKLKKRIKYIIKDTLDLEYEYEGKNRKKKTVRPLLLLHNVQSVIDQNECVENEKKYSLPDFTRFPFHLYRKEWWDIEHIRPNNVQDFEGPRKKKLRRKYAYVLEHGLSSKLNDPISIPNEIKVDTKKKIQDADGKTTLGIVINLYEESYEASLKNPNSSTARNEEVDLFNALWIVANSNDSELPESEKNKIWNYVLLDASTNREYGNSCYSIKRDFIMKKENGIKPVLEVSDKEVDKTQRVEAKEISETAFVPICTMRVFAKTYTEYSSDSQYWTERDAAYYRLDIEKRLWWYFFDEIVDKKTRDRISDKDKKSYYMYLFDNYYKHTVKEEAYKVSMKKYYDNLAKTEIDKLYEMFTADNH